MGLLCWKFCPARESCGYFCSNMGRVCCCIGSPSGSKDTIPVDPFVDAKESKLSVRRISRVDSEESLDALEDQTNTTEHTQVSPPPSETPGGRKFTKKISLHRRALKSMIKGGGYASTPDLRNEDSDGKDEGFKRSRLHLPKYFVSASSSDDIMMEEREDIEKKHKLRNLLKESRKAARGNKDTQQMHLALSLPDQALLPPLRGELDEFQGGGNRDPPGMRQGYGSLLQIPVTKEEGSDYALSDEDKTETMGSRSLCSGSQEYLLDEETDQMRFDGSSEWMSASEKERGEGDGSSMSVGSKDNPSLECFGSITLTTRLISSKAISVSILSLQGLPCRKGKDSGLTLEIMLISGGKSVWLPLPQAQGPKVVVNSDVSVKIPSSASKSKEEKEHLVRICVWASGRTWKHCALGNAFVALAEKEQLPATLGLYQHTQAFQGLGLLEVSIEYTSEDSKAQIVVQIQRAKFSKELIAGKSIASLKSVYRHKRDVWCRLSLWSKGRRIEKETTPKIFLPVSYDPTFRTMTKFQVNRSLLPFTSLVIKVLLDKGLGLGQIVLGKLVLGPHLYLGISKGDTPPGTLSHWGKALTHSGPVTAWHYLYQ